MNLATPILIGDSSEEFRSLLRDMLTKHGFFHIVEATASNEVAVFLEQETKDFFVLIQSELLNENIIEKIQQKNFLILAQSNKNETISLAARLGVKYFLSFPFSSQGLVEKIKMIAQ